MSASPLAQDGGEQGIQDEASKKIQFQFCRECSNLLYPKEDKESNTLLFECRTCRWNREAESTCVYRNELANTVGETAGITQDVASDPTVGAQSAAAAAAAPQQPDAIPPAAHRYDHGTAGAAPPLPESALPDFCTMCGQEIFCETCGNPSEFGFYLEVEDQDVVMTDSNDGPPPHRSSSTAMRSAIDEDYDTEDTESEPPTPSHEQPHMGSHSAG